MIAMKFAIWRVNRILVFLLFSSDFVQNYISTLSPL